MGVPQGRPVRAEQDDLAGLQLGRAVQLKSRGLTASTCAAWDYRVWQKPDGSYEQMAIYRDRQTGRAVGIKYRDEHKEFRWEGKSHHQLWGAHKWSGGGKRIVIVGGEIDALTVSQCYAHKWPVVSVPDGEAAAAKAIKANLEWLLSFEEVVLGMDNDEVGRKANLECAQLFPPGKVRIAKWSGKDPNEMLQDGRGDQVTLCVHNAEPYRPDGIVDARTLTPKLLTPPTWGIPWPWEFMTKWTYGRRYGELYMFGSGTGMGKTDILAEIAASTLTGTTKDGHATYAPEAFAVFGYEAMAEVTKMAIAGKIAGHRFHIPQDPEFPEWTEKDLRSAMDRMDGPIWDGGGKLFINDSRGAPDWDAFKERCRYLRHAEGIRHFIGDPMSAWVAGEDDERKMLDAITLEAANLAVELEACIYIASHLTRPKDGPSHEEGGQVRLGQFRGSNGIGMFSNFVFGLERNQQAENEADRAVATVRVVKDRFTGNAIGKTAQIVYDQLTGSYDVPASKFLEGDEE